MIGDYHVVSVTPAGRKRYVELLSQYILKERGLIDYHEWWLNTDASEDVEYLNQLAAQHPDFFRVVSVNSPFPPIEKRNMRIHKFFPRTVATNTIYLRLDDDIVYIAPGAIRKLLEFRIKDPNPLLVYPCIVNNSRISCLLQRNGAIPMDSGVCGYETLGMGWKDPAFAELVHRSFLGAMDANDLTKWEFDEWHLRQYECVSINAICWFGRDFDQFGGRVRRREEQFLSCIKPRQLGRPNSICGRSLVVHFSYAPQNAYLDTTDLLEKYKVLAPKLQ